MNKYNGVIGIKRVVIILNTIVALIIGLMANVAIFKSIREMFDVPSGFVLIFVIPYAMLALCITGIIIIFTICNIVSHFRTNYNNIQAMKIRVKNQVFFDFLIGMALIGLSIISGNGAIFTIITIACEMIFMAINIILVAKIS